MDSHIRVKFRVVIPLLVAVVILCWIMFHSKDPEKELIIKKLQAEIDHKDEEIAKMRNQILKQLANQRKVDQRMKDNNVKKAQEDDPKKFEIKNNSKKFDIKDDSKRFDIKDDSKRPFDGKKLIHLDLKGGAPKMNYLLELIPMLKKWGANGLLVEYEDMFPYDQDLSVLKSAYAYSISEIKQLLDLVQKYDLLIVPLVQTFGHMEFVLKHEKFANLRHVANMTNAINPGDSGSIPLVKSMVDQMMKIHKPYIKYLHIGGDEVWNLKLEKENSVNDIYIKHMSPIIDHVVSNDVIPILWDDMMRKWTVQELKRISSKPVEPMVWGYVPELRRLFPKDMWERYGQAFKNVWIASAFKGAEDAYTNFVSIEERIQNHESWLGMKSTFDSTNVKVSGIALTGWSRFDHDSTLCELLPVSLPSLALCLAVLREGQLSDKTLSTVSGDLGFRDPIALNPQQIPRYPERSHEGTFSGHDVYGVVLRLRAVYNTMQSVEVRVVGWFNDRQVKTKMINNFHLSICFKRLDSVISRLGKLKATVKKKFTPFFNDDIINEWIWDKVDSKRRHALKLKQRLMKLQSAGDKTTAR